jgi:hypothetical protein
LAFYNPSALFLVAALGFTSGTLALMLTRFANDETDDSQLSIRTAEGDI